MPKRELQMKSAFLKLILGMVLIALLIIVVTLWPYTTEYSETKDGITRIEYRRHYAFDLHDAGHGRFLDEQICVDAAKVCVRADSVFYSYPRRMPKAQWAMLCETETGQWRYFDRFHGNEIKCHNCDVDASSCVISPQIIQWIDGNQFAQVVGNKVMQLTTLRHYNLTNEGVTVNRIQTIPDFAYGSDTGIASRLINREKTLAWVDCNDLSCSLYTLNFLTGKFTRELTPCRFGNKLVIESLEDGRALLQIQYQAKGDEVCLNSEGKPAYPFAPIPPPLPQFANPPIIEEAPKAAPEPSNPVMHHEPVQPKPVKKLEEDEPEFGD
jgi:hypothetical protein